MTSAMEQHWRTWMVVILSRWSHRTSQQQHVQHRVAMMTLMLMHDDCGVLLALVQTARRVLKSEFDVHNLPVIVDFVSHSLVNHSIVHTLTDVHTAGFLLSYYFQQFCDTYVPLCARPTVKYLYITCGKSQLCIASFFCNMLLIYSSDCLVLDFDWKSYQVISVQLLTCAVCYVRIEDQWINTEIFQFCSVVYSMRHSIMLVQPIAERLHLQGRSVLAKSGWKTIFCK